MKEVLGLQIITIVLFSIFSLSAYADCYSDYTEMLNSMVKYNGSITSTNGYQINRLQGNPQGDSQGDCTMNACERNSDGYSPFVLTWQSGNWGDTLIANPSGNYSYCN